MAKRSEKQPRKRLTEDKFLGRRQHVQGEGYFVLVLFSLYPANESRCVAHLDATKAFSLLNQEPEQRLVSSE